MITVLVSAFLSTPAMAQTVYFNPDAGGVNQIMAIDPSTGASAFTGLSSGVTGATAGLSKGPGNCSIIGSRPFGNRRTDLCTGTQVNSTTRTWDWEGMAHEPGGKFYGITAGQLAEINPITNNPTVFLAPAPVDCDGLAYAAPGLMATPGLFALSDIDHHLYWYDIPSNTWFDMGLTQLTELNWGLAYDPTIQQVYAKGQGTPFLWSIDPITLNAAVVANIGDTRGGGLTWVP